MNDASVLANGVLAPLTYVGPTQINGQLPYSAPAGTVAIRVKRRNVVGITIQVPVRVAAPCIFVQGASKRAAAVNQEGTLNLAESPAKAGSIVTIYFTGQGAVSPPVVSGQAAQGEVLSRVTSPASAAVGGRPAQILYLGLTPGLAGVAQANIRIPELAAGDHAVQLTIAGIRSNSPTIAVEETQ
jgi:uncharacterized protein (TIGR03437 family)